MFMQQQPLDKRVTVRFFPADFGDRFAHNWVRHHPVLPNPGTSPSSSDRPFLPGFALPVSGPIGLCTRTSSPAAISTALSPHPKFPFLAHNAQRLTFFEQNQTSVAMALLWDVRYCGFNPSTSNWRLHSAGASRSRSMLMPRGRRPSTAARTSLGARKASEMVMLT